MPPETEVSISQVGEVEKKYGLDKMYFQLDSNAGIHRLGLRAVMLNSDMLGIKVQLNSLSARLFSVVDSWIQNLDISSNQDIDLIIESIKRKSAKYDREIITIRDSMKEDNGREEDDYLLEKVRANEILVSIIPRINKHRIPN